MNTILSSCKDFILLVLVLYMGHTKIDEIVTQTKGSDAATAMGAEAAVYAAEASDANDLLERILPASVSDYVDLVKAHIEAGESRNVFFNTRT